MDLGTSAASFPPTSMSLIQLAAQKDAPMWKEAWERFFRAYWPPLYTYLRRTGSPTEQAQDILQEFFFEGLERGLLAKFDPSRGKFRSWVRSCLRNQRLELHRHEARRRDHRPLEFLETEMAEAEIARSPAADAEDSFEQEWNRRLLARAIDGLAQKLEAAGDTAGLRLLKEWVLAEQKPAAADFAASLGIATGTMHTRATRMRHALVAEVEAQAREYASDQNEAREETDIVLRLFGGGVSP